MNKEKVTQVVTDVINDKITQLIEEMSTNEFVDMIKDKLVENGIEFDDNNEEESEEIFEIVGSRVVPLLHKMSEYIIGVNIPID
jgi:hypothetical protein